VSCLWSDQSEFMALFVGLNLRSGPNFIFEPVLNFEFLGSHFLVTTLGLNLFSGICHNNLLYLWHPVTENHSI